MVTSPRHHEQAPPILTKLGCTQSGNQTRLTNYVETRTGQAPQPLTKTTYEGVCTPTRRDGVAFCGRSRLGGELFGALDRACDAARVLLCEQHRGIGHGFRRLDHFGRDLHATAPGLPTLG